MKKVKGLSGNKPPEKITVPTEATTADDMLFSKKPLHEHTIEELEDKLVRYDAALYNMVYEIPKSTKTIVGRMVDQLGKSIKGLGLADAESVWFLKLKLSGNSFTCISDHNLHKSDYFKNNSVEAIGFGEKEVGESTKFYYKVSSSNVQLLTKTANTLSEKGGVDVYYKNGSSSDNLFLDMLDLRIMQTMMSHYELDSQTCESAASWVKHFEVANISIYKLHTAIKQATSLLKEKRAEVSAQMQLDKIAHKGGKEGFTVDEMAAKTLDKEKAVLVPVQDDK